MKYYEITAKQIEELKKFDSPTISNVIATYPERELCLKLYNPWETNWYTDQTCKCMYPELRSYIGYAVTVVYGLPDSYTKNLSKIDIFNAVNDTPRPSILVVEQRMPEKYLIKSGMAGGKVVTALKSLGCIGLITNGPSRDISEVREIGGFQMLLTGVTVGHGDFSVNAVNVPVSVCSMDVAPGELIHMDEHGAVKFPAERTDEIIDLAYKLVELEKKQMREMRDAKTPSELFKQWSTKRG
jgi:regulator of RNase E activity RraA